MDKRKIKWMVNRLTAMSPLEILFRIIRKPREILYKNKYKKYRLITEKNLFNSNIKELWFHGERFYKKYDDSFREILFRDYSIYCNELLTYADSVTDKKFTIFKIYPVDFSNGINWNITFNKDNSWPLIFSPNVDFRQAENLGDIRFNFELNRHQLLTTLSAAFFISKDIKYLKSLQEYFYSFIENNPFMYGVSWISSMEVAIRAFSWMFSLSLIKACIEVTEVSPHLTEDMEWGIKNQINFVYNHYSLYSSANNHLIVESALVGIAGILFNNDRWLNSGIKIISREIEKQVTSDGVDREQALHYQAFVMEAISLFILLLKKNDIKYPNIIDKKLEKMNDFICDISNVIGNPPDLGDNDEGCIFNILNKDEKFNYYGYVLKLGELINNKDYLNGEKSFSDTLFIRNFKFHNMYKYKKNIGLITYKQGGYSVFRYENGINERLLIFDHGFLGYKTLCAHGHADALSLNLSVDGEFVITDPGTYIYNIERNFRDYFRKTINHNTIEIDGMDQSEIKGSFLWGRKAKVKLIGTGANHGYIWACAEHDGYSPVIHRREVKFFEPDTFIIDDYIKGKCNKLVQSFILGKDVHIEQATDKSIIIKSKSGHIGIYCKGAGSFTLEEVYSSPHFGKKEIVTAIRRRIDNVENETLQTIICVDFRLQ